MIYRVVTYDRATERMKGSLTVPPSVLSLVQKIARFEPLDDGRGEYPLDEDQTNEVARVLGFKPEADRFYYYVEPYDPPEDNGFGEPSLTGNSEPYQSDAGSASRIS